MPIPRSTLRLLMTRSVDPFTIPTGPSGTTPATATMPFILQDVLVAAYADRDKTIYTVRTDLLSEIVQGLEAALEGCEVKVLRPKIEWWTPIQIDW